MDRTASPPVYSSPAKLRCQWQLAYTAMPAQRPYCRCETRLTRILPLRAPLEPAQHIHTTSKHCTTTATCTMASNSCPASLRIDVILAVGNATFRSAEPAARAWVDHTLKRTSLNVSWQAAFQHIRRVLADRGRVKQRGSACCTPLPAPVGLPRLACPPHLGLAWQSRALAHAAGRN